MKKLKIMKKLIKFSEMISKWKWLDTNLSLLIFVILFIGCFSFIDEHNWVLLVMVGAFLVFMFFALSGRMYLNYKKNLFKNVKLKKRQLYFNQAIDAIINNDLDKVNHLKENFIKSSKDIDYLLGLMLGMELKDDKTRTKIIKTITKEKYNI